MRRAVNAPRLKLHFANYNYNSIVSWPEYKLTKDGKRVTAEELVSGCDEATSTVQDMRVARFLGRKQSTDIGRKV